MIRSWVRDPPALAGAVPSATIWHVLFRKGVDRDRGSSDDFFPLDEVPFRETGKCAHHPRGQCTRVPPASDGPAKGTGQCGEDVPGIRHLPQRVLSMADALPGLRPGWAPHPPAGGQRGHPPTLSAPPIVIEQLPTYAPDLKPVGYRRGHWQNHALPKPAQDCLALSDHARAALHRMRRLPTLITAF